MPTWWARLRAERVRSLVVVRVIGDLGAQGLEAEAIAVLEDHHPQVGLHRDRGPAVIRAEARPERLEEPRVVQQLVHLGQPRGKPPGLFGQDRVPKRLLGAYGT